MPRSHLFRSESRASERHAGQRNILEHDALKLHASIAAASLPTSAKRNSACNIKGPVQCWSKKFRTNVPCHAIQNSYNKFSIHLHRKSRSCRIFWLLRPRRVQRPRRALTRRRWQPWPLHVRPLQTCACAAATVRHALQHMASCAAA